jgi:selenocysteine-specific elongation factor
MNKPADTNAHGSTISLTVGTAGHIDHGKTELIKYLTGCNTDRLPEEKARGMTIDLGFATCQLPDDRQVGIVDVPGHERFVHNMVAGAAGIDVVILVIAADDGVMPQTIEHFHIVRMLGVTSGMLVITKSDLATPERINEVEQQIKTLVAGSFLENSPIVPFSAKTGEGFDGFYSAFTATVSKTAERNAEGPFRLNVERSFVMQGRGAIVSGIPSSGKVSLGKELELLPSGSKKKVRGLQVYGIDSEVGQAGECLALRMSDMSTEEAKRGVTLAEPGFFSPTRFVNARFQLLPHVKKALRPRTAVRFHVGTADIPGHLVLPTAKSLSQGEESYVQFQLKRPVITAPGDFFVARLLSPAITIGGGYVVTPETVKMRRSRTNWSDKCEEREQAFKQPKDALVFVLKDADPIPLAVKQLAHMTFLNEDAVTEHLSSLLEDGSVIELRGERYMHKNVMRLAEETIIDILNKAHDEKPVSVGFHKKEIFREIDLGRVVIDKAIANLIESGVAISSDNGLALKERAPQLSPQQATVADSITEIYIENGFTSPRADGLPELIGTPEPVIRPILGHLIQTGVIVDVGENVLLHSDCVETAKKALVEHIETEGSISAGAFKTLLDTSRKYAIPLLEYFDKQGLTVRRGNERFLRK